ncbi:50S ribosomal protein L32 [Candidatus Peregrinibacteria bacterium]|nr:50S ribosomal protein L32 [Candidatus Peregrinibacteria bacterium]
MAKKATPKKQQSNARSSRRYKTFRNNTRKRLLAGAKLTKCPACKELIPTHTACPYCGKYKGREVLNMKKEMEKITKVKA